MHPISFPEHNTVLGKPADMTDEQCIPLPCHKYDQFFGKDPDTGEDVKFPAIISCWKLTTEELEEVQRTGVIWANTIGQTLAPFSLQTNNPFQQPQAIEG